MEQTKLLEEGEVMIEKIRKHWIVYVEDFALHLFASVVFLVGAVFLASRGVLPFLSGDDVARGAMVLVMFVLIFWTSFFYFWTKNYFDVWYITDRHIIAVNQKQMFEREEAFMELSKVQDVSFEKNGFIATFFGYGKLQVQTAGSEQVFVISDVREVEFAAHQIMDLRDTKQGRKAAVSITS